MKIGIFQIEKSCVVSQLINGESTNINCYGKCITKYSKDNAIKSYGYYMLDGKVKQITNGSFVVEVNKEDI
ncbi:MAG: hypothetical protein GY750_20885 [Lentisphaerae bacterium]|nr:hypothetical protein [Lentisphaerota bacterium]